MNLLWRQFTCKICRDTFYRQIPWDKKDIKNFYNICLDCEDQQEVQKTENGSKEFKELCYLK
jgi:7,8-dihydro-6-hydroxymethylpterin-pyrophosphokinase